MSAIDLGGALLATARHVLDGAFGVAPGAPAQVAALDERGATFVTLMQHGELRGCIGTLDAHRSLRADVEDNTLAAAFRDPRFAPLEAAELDSTRIEISLLSASTPLPVKGERDLLQRLQPGIDGIVIRWRGSRATFLPQVWDHLPDPQAFLGALKRKAGLDADFWDDGIRVARYTVTKFREPAATFQDVTG